MNIGGVSVGYGQPCRVIAELSNNHGGSLDRAIRMIDAAKDVGCDFVKFQAFVVQELIDLRGDGPAPEPWGSQGWTMHALYTKAQTPLHWFPHLFKHARKIGIVPFASFFGSQSFHVLKRVDCPAYKLAALDRQHLWLRDIAYSTSVPVIVSVPTREEARQNYGNAAFLFAPPGYPQTDVKMTPGMFGDPNYFNRHGNESPFLGFSYHGTHTRPAIVAATLGAKLIEAHFQLDDEPGELEANVSLTAKQFAWMIQEIRATEVLLG